MAAPINPPAPGAIGSVDFPPWLKFAVALFVVGAAAEALHSASPTASYLFVLLVIMGFAATGGNLANLQAFLGSVIRTGK